MANLKIAPGVKPKKTKQAKRDSRKPSRRRSNHGGWLTTAKIVLLLQRQRRRREGESSSPSVPSSTLINPPGPAIRCPLMARLYWTFVEMGYRAITCAGKKGIILSAI